MLCRLETTNSNMLTSILEIENPKTWKNSTIKIMQELGINPNITTNKKTQQQKEIHPALDKNYTERMKQNKEKKSKVKFLLTNIKDRKIGNRPLYMEKLNRYQVSTIFKARTRMLDVKNNFRGKYKDNICRGCGTTEETQEHVLNECTGIHYNQESKVQLQEIFDENTEQLKGKAEKIDHIMTRLTKSGVVPKEVMQPGDLGNHLT